MAFEPLLTDEKLDNPPPKERDMDTAMLLGCSGFVGVSLITFSLVLWPHFIWTDVFQIRVLGMACAVGMIPACIVGIVAARKGALAGACGFVGGAMAAAVFLFLRLQQIKPAVQGRDALEADYPLNFAWMVPVGWLCLAALIAIIATPRDRLV